MRRQASCRSRPAYSIIGRHIVRRTGADEGLASDTVSYEQAGVNYDLIDPMKIAAQRAAAATGAHLGGHGFSPRCWLRAASRPMWWMWAPSIWLAIVECLGTKTLVADEMAKLTGKSFFAGIAQDTIAMAINDLITSRRHATGGAGLLGRRWLRTGSATSCARKPWSKAGRRPATPARSPGAAASHAGPGRHRRGRPHRPGRCPAPA